MDVLKERKKKIKDILTPHILYGKLSEEQIIEMIRIESADYKNKSAGKMGELRSEIERRRLLRLRRLNPDEFDRRIDKMLERPSKDVDEKRTRLPRGLTPMQEKFCMEYTATGDELASYKKAGFKEAKDDPNTRIRARQLLKNEKIQARIDEYQKEAIRKISWTKEKVLEKIAEVYSNSINDGDFTNANRAMENIAKHLGMFVDLSKVEQTVKTTGFESGDKKADIKKLADLAGFKLIDGGVSGKKVADKDGTSGNK